VCLLSAPGGPGGRTRGGLSILPQMRAEFFRPDAPDRVVGVAVWDGRRAEVESEDEEVRAALGRIFRASSVAVDDPSLRPAGTAGETVVEPGDGEWFRVAARVRAPAEGLSVRFVSERPGGWDPALDPETYGWAGRKSPLPSR
jgi:hypothetical protein